MFETRIRTLLKELEREREGKMCWNICCNSFWFFLASLLFHFQNWKRTKVSCETELSRLMTRSEGENIQNREREKERNESECVREKGRIIKIVNGKEIVTVVITFDIFHSFKISPPLSLLWWCRDIHFVPVIQDLSVIDQKVSSLPLSLSLSRNISSVYVAQKVHSCFLSLSLSLPLSSIGNIFFDLVLSLPFSLTESNIQVNTVCHSLNHTPNLTVEKRERRSSYKILTKTLQNQIKRELWKEKGRERENPFK